MAYGARRFGRFEVFGNYGVMQVDSSNGLVISLDESSSDADELANYRDIRRFDVVEWKEHYSGNQPDGTSIDILDIGFWYGHSELYAAPPQRDAFSA